MTRYEVYLRVQEATTKLVCDEDDDKLIDIYNEVTGEDWYSDEKGNFYECPSLD